jgi:ABC-type multidrug transport system ATPase subunit
MPDLIKVSNLVKKFDDFTAVNNLSFTVPEGSIYGFLGQNGAGKSTTIRMLTTLLRPTSGTIEIFGTSLAKNPTGILKDIGAVIERPDLYKYLTAFENVHLFAKLSGVRVAASHIKDTLALVGLQDAMYKKMKTFSQGMKQRLGIAVALAHNPKLIILDEPVNGLDPQGIAAMRNLILHLKNDMGKTVLVSSHLLSEMEMIATDLLIIHKGQKIVEGKLTDLLQPNRVQIELQTKELAQNVVTVLQNSNWADCIKHYSDNKTILNLPKEEVSLLNIFLVEKNIAIQSLKPQQTLEDYFIQQTSLS